MNMYAGIDIGSVSIKAAVVKGREILKTYYTRIEGKPVRKAYTFLKQIFDEYPEISGISATGSGGKLLSDILGIPSVNEIVAQVVASSLLYPAVRSIIEIGGEDSKFIAIRYDKALKMHTIEDFAMNTICAAGTGAFLDQQAGRLGIAIDDFGALALKSDKPARIAGRCSVFANSDIIHLQQEATSIEDISAGLCFAFARNFKSSIVKNRKLGEPVAFQGGVAANKGMVKAFKETFNLKDGELIIPEYFPVMGAIGAGIESQKSKIKNQNVNIEKLLEFSHQYTHKTGLPGNRPPLKSIETVQQTRLSVIGNQLSGSTMNYVWMGIDVGSISTKIAFIGANKKLIASCYLWTAGKPIDAVKQALKQMPHNVDVKGVGVTGSGRAMIGDIVGADVVKNEITAQARASIELNPDVDTIFEIGGQDSKYISLRNGIICDFEMNKVCAAGTGSFLEEQAERLNLNINGEFSEEAFDAKTPVPLGERCTVFMQSDLTSWQQKGARTNDLAAGLAYSIAENYLNKVVGNKKIGSFIFFQGAVAHNKAIVSAFESLLNRQVTVPPNNELTGAIGVALLVMENSSYSGQGTRAYPEDRTRFKGFDLCEKSYKVEKFECKACPNNCEIKKVLFENEAGLYYGSRCEKYDTTKVDRVKGPDLPSDSHTDLFELREKLLLMVGSGDPTYPLLDTRHPVVGIPRSLLFYEYLPFFTTFFHKIGANVVLSDPTTKRIIDDGIEYATCEHCFPVKVCHGHILNLLKKKVDYIFLPSFISLPKEQGMGESYTCPYIQAVPYVVSAAIPQAKLLKPVLYFRRSRKHLIEALVPVADKLGISRDKVALAIESAFIAQDEFYNSIAKNSEFRIQNSEFPKVVIIGRPYNTCDNGLNLNIPRILNNLGALPIPMDFLPLNNVNIMEDWDNMYWRCGQKILAAAKFIKDQPNLYPLYITNFGCGADSFILQYFEEELKDKPHLVIEIDEHSGTAGVITRCEAFIDSISLMQGTGVASKHQVASIQSPRINSGDAPVFRIQNSHRTLCIPFMGYHSYAVKSAFRHFKINAEVMPPSDEKSIELGKRHTTGKECFPCILTTGDMLKVLETQDSKNIAFFMPESCGPCRFGQYNKLQRLILSRLEYGDVPIISPNQAKGFYKALKEYGNDFDKRAWYGICLVDLLDKLARKIRPYELNKGDTDEVYFSTLDLICKALENNGNVIKMGRVVKEKFNAIPVKRIKKPVIGITGEIYIRTHHFANNNLIKRIEELGGEVWFPETAEWFFYINFRRLEDAVANKNYKQWLLHCAKNLYQKWVKLSVGQASCSIGQASCLSEIRKLFKYAYPWLHHTVEGEAVLSVGKSIDFIKEGADGIITVMPFTCMPGTNTVAIMTKVKDKYKIPYLNIAYDGLQQTSLDIRLSAFIHQAYQHMGSS